MKKLFTTLLLVFSVMASYAHDFEVDGIYYNLNKEAKEAVVTYKGLYYWNNDYYGFVKIPSSISYGNATYSVTSIGDRAFRACTGLTYVEIPNSVTSIGEGAFIGCSALASLPIPNSVTSIGISAFQDCLSLASITIPNSVTSIGYGTFSGCYGLKSVTIPNSVTSIGESAFSNCSSLTSIIIPNSVTKIEQAVFSNCSSLTSVEIPNLITSIGGSAFSGCSALTAVTIPNSVTSIGGLAFKGCSHLREIHSNNITPPECGPDVFNGVQTANCRLYVPTGSKDDYAYALGWGNFVNIIEEAVINPSADIEKPSITYDNKRLTFSCGTPDVTYSYTIKAEDNTSNLTDSENGEVNLSATYIITAYAKKDGMTSEPSTAALVWATATFTPGEDMGVKEMTVDTLPLLIMQEDA